MSSGSLSSVRGNKLENRKNLERRRTAYPSHKLLGGPAQKMVILRDSFYFSKLTDTLHLGDYITQKKVIKKVITSACFFMSENKILRLLVFLLVKKCFVSCMSI